MPIRGAIPTGATPGTHDLDAYGRWEKVQDYGDVWVPNEPDGWVPYRDGNWVWEPSYGWTWVGYEPWGWAPYHYGRWFPYGASWAWWPGPVWAGYNPLWAPAYVSFWGWGGGFGFGVGFGGWGGFGWLPLGPCDWFHPWWGGYRGPLWCRERQQCQRHEHPHGWRNLLCMAECATPTWRTSATAALAMPCRP